MLLLSLEQEMGIDSPLLTSTSVENVPHALKYATAASTDWRHERVV